MVSNRSCWRVYSLYWLGLYESSSMEVLPSLFETDYTPAIQAILKLSQCFRSSTDYSDIWLLPLFLVFGGGIALGFVFLHLLAIVICIAWTYPWFTGLSQLWTEKVQDSDPTNETPLSHPTFYDTAFTWSFSIFWSLGACGAIATGLGGCCVVILSLVKTITNSVKSLMSYIRLRFGTEIFDGMEHNFTRLSYIFPRVPSTIPRFFTTPTFSIFTGSKCLLRSYTRNSFCVVLLTGVLIVGYIIVHAIGLMVCISWSMLWVYGLVELWKNNLSQTKFSSSVLFAWSLGLLWSAGACFAVGVGCVGCGIVLASLFRPVLSSSRSLSILNWFVNSSWCNRSLSLSHW